MGEYKCRSLFAVCLLILDVRADSIRRLDDQGQDAVTQDAVAFPGIFYTDMLGKEEMRDGDSGNGDGKDIHEVFKYDYRESSAANEKLLAVAPVGGFRDNRELPVLCQCKGNVCDCSKRHLLDVPDYLPTNVTELDLSGNDINALKNCTFCNYTRLHILNIANNRLKTITVDAFMNLHHLEVLSLENNYITLPQHLPEPKAIFRNLPSLTSLRVGRNKHFFAIYQPDVLFAELTNLQELFMDGLNCSLFRSGFRNLTLLRRLTLEGFRQGFCRLTTLENETFTNLDQLTYLDISSCGIKDIDSEVFKPLQSLESLNISFNYQMGLRGLLTSLSSLTHSNITTLTMNYINSYHSESVCITNETITSLPLKLAHLEAIGNSFELIDPGILQYVPENLSYANLGNNRFIYGKYVNDLYYLKKLKKLKLNGGFNVPDLPNSDQPSLLVQEMSSLNGYSRKSNAKKPKLFLNLPPILERIEMDVGGLRYILSEVDVDPNNSLKILSISKNYFPALLGPITGLERLTYLDFRQSSVNTLHRDFFGNLTGLRHLMLGHNTLRKFFHNYRKGSRVFFDLKNLITLDLSHNDLTVIPTDMFEGLNNLEILLMNFSSMWQFNVSISHMSKLRLVNLSNSQLSDLPDQVRNHIDALCENKTHDLRVDLSWNPLRCECNNLDFLTWMVNSRAFDRSFTNYLCKYPDDFYKVINDSYAGTMMMLNRTCAQNGPMFLAVLAATLGMLGFVVAGILFRYRWKIRYFYYAAYTKLKDKHASRDADTFRYDVFVSYAAKDEAFVINDVSPELSARGLRLHVHGRDFVAGDFIASNIVTAVKESRKTLVVLTRNLLASTWCNYELQMANMESVHTGRPVLVFLVKESIPNNELGTDLLYHIRNNTYILYPQEGEDEMQAKIFWDKVASDLRH